jgi:GntR family transcriptional regulator
VVLEFHIATGSSVPIYRQIVDHVRRSVATGDLVPGAQLPSVRALAEQLVINPNTVARAYSDLVREGVVQSHAGKGLFIAPRRQLLSPEERALRLDQALDTFLNEVLFLDFSQTEILELLKRKLNEIAAPPSAPAAPSAPTVPAASARPASLSRTGSEI